MFEPVPELSRDLDWMLQSGQASPGMLVESLVYEYYTPVYHLASFVLDDSRAALYVTRKTFSQALLNVYSYRSQVGVDLWLFQIAVDGIRRSLQRLKRGRVLKLPPAFPENPYSSRIKTSPDDQEAALSSMLAHLPTNSKLLIFFKYLLDWEIADLSALLNKRQKSLEAELQRLQARMLPFISSDQELPDTGQNPPLEGRLEDWVNASIRARWPSLNLSQENLFSEMQVILTDSGEKSAQRERSTSFKELFFTGLISVLVVALIWFSSRLMGDEEEAPLEKSTQIVTQIVRKKITATPPPPAKTLVPDGYPKKAIYYTAHKYDSLNAIAARLNIAVEELERLNNFDREQILDEGQLVVIATLPITPVAAAVRPPTMTQPLDESSTSAQVLGRLLDSSSLWQTLWFDAYIIYHGPPGFIGQPRVKQEQTWISQPYNSLVLTGQPGGEPDQIWYALDGKVYDVDPSNGDVFLYDFHPGKLPVYSAMEKFIFPDGLVEKTSSLDIIGTDEVAGRTTLVVDRFGEANTLDSRLWIDTNTGLILRARQYAEDSDTSTIEFIIQKVAFNVDFPDKTFDRSSLLLRFAKDYLGAPQSSGETQLSPLSSPVPGRLPLPETPAPVGYDFSTSELVFQWNQPPGEQDSTPVKVFADNFFLGELQFQNPSRVFCDRSSDGEWIAFIPDVLGQPATDLGVHWFRVSPSPVLSNAMPDIRPQGSVAIAPGGSRIAVYGCSIHERRDSRCGVYVLDPATGAYPRILPSNNVYRVAWDREGAYLAVLGFMEGAQNISWVVMETDNWQIVYTEELTEIPRQEQLDRVQPEWFVTDLDASSGNLEACGEAPEADVSQSPAFSGQSSR
jgi:DNA-directed RNA polymerase specialized sigma24 family protein